jgi:hypothetical protein
MYWIHMDWALLVKETTAARRLRLILIRQAAVAEQEQ